MYKNSFGTKSQVHFSSEHEYYALLGYLAKNDGSTYITWEHNEQQGAWTSEGRIQINVDNFPFMSNVILTAGVGQIVSRVNCNDFIEHLNAHHNFQNRVEQQDVESIRSTIPEEYMPDFERGLLL